MIVQGAFNLLFRAGLRKDFRDSYNKYAPEYPQFLKVSSTTMPEQTATIITGLNRFLERGDGEAITYEDPKIGPKVVGVDKEFALGFMISRRTVEDDQYGKANSASKWLAHAAYLTKEYRAAALLDDAFTGATFLGIDSQPLISTAHTFLNGSGTWSNRVASNIGVSMTGITSMLDLAQVAKDHNGDPIPMNLDRLIIGNNAGDLNRAMQIFGSTLEPFTSDNTENAIKKRIGGTKIIVSHYKSDANSWFMQDSTFNDAHFVMRREVDYDDTFDFDTDAAKYKGSMRFLVWFVDPRGWFGSDPA